jgi:hypothetical protein
MAKLKTALENAVSGKAGVQSASYPAPKVEPVNAFGVLEPDINDAVNNTYIVIDPAPTATSVVSFYWNGDETIPLETSDGSSMRVKVPPALVIAAANTTIAVIYAVVGPDDPQGVASSPLSLVVGKYTEPAYPKPVITEAQGGELDVTQLKANAHVTVQPWPGIAVGQMLWLNAVSSPPIKLTKWQGFRITSTGVQSTVIGLTALQTLDHDTDLTLKLEVSFDDGATKKPFPLATYKIINAKDLDLPAPVLKEASGGVLNPINVLNGATATVEYTDMLLIDSITLVWNGDKTSIAAKPGNTDKKVDFAVPVNLIAAAMGKSIEVSYEVTRHGEVLLSKILSLQVSALSEENLSQSTPLVDEAENGLLDLNMLEGDAHVTVPNWPLAAAGQTVWLKVAGSNGVPTLELLTGYPIETDEVRTGLNVAIKRGDLEKFADRSELKVFCKIGFSGSGNEEATTALTIPIFIIKSQPPVYIEDFEALGPPFSEHTTLDTPAMTISSTTTFYLAQINPHYMPYVVNMCIAPPYRPETATDTITFTLKTPATTVRFGAYSGATTALIHYINKEGTVLKRDFTLLNQRQWIEYTSSAQSIHKITMTSSHSQNQVVWVDNFTITYKKVTAAFGRALDGTATLYTDPYPPPKISTADIFNILDPNKDNAVDSTYIVITNIPATYLVSFYWNGDYSIESVTSEGKEIRVKVPANLVIAAGDIYPQSIIVIYSVLNPTVPGGVASDSLLLTVRKYVRPKPLIVEANDATNELDVGALTADAHLSLARWPGQDIGQKLWLRVVSTPQITLQNWNPLTVSALGEQRRVIAKAKLKTLADESTFTLMLEASFDAGATCFAFSEQAYKIINVKELDLPAPVVKEAISDVLNPVAVSSGATATVAYADMLATDSITLIWNGDKTSIAAKPGNTDKKVDFAVPVNLIAAAMGKSIEVSYEVTRHGKALPSRKLTLTVNQLSAGDLDPFKPIIVEANGTTVVDLNTFEGDAHIKVAEWPLAAVGQRVWLTVYGPTGAPLAQLLTGFPITEADGLNGIARSLAREQLDSLSAKASIRVEMKVTFDGSTNEISAIRFPEPVYSIVPVIVIPTLTIDTSMLVLSGRLVRFGGTPTTPPPGTSATRVASGGVPPYKYSVEPNAVDINATTGKVIAFRDGQGTVTVTDDSGQTAQYVVSVSNVLDIDGWTGDQTYNTATNLAASYGGRLPTLEEWRFFRTAYNGAPGIENGSGQAWSSTSAGGDNYYTISPNTGAEATIGAQGIAKGWAILRRLI